MIELCISVQKYVYYFFFESENITETLVEFEPQVTNIVVAPRADVPVRSSAASKVPVETL